MPKLTGTCLCGAVSFKADGLPVFQANCHCKDCRQATEAAFGTLVFMKETDVKVTGPVKSFKHSVENGNVLSKEFCENCGSQMFVKNSARLGLFGLRAGSINEQEHVQPQINVYAGSKMDFTVLDPNLPAPDKMPT